MVPVAKLSRSDSHFLAELALRAGRPEDAMPLLHAIATLSLQPGAEPLSLAERETLRLMHKRKLSSLNRSLRATRRACVEERPQRRLAEAYDQTLRGELDDACVALPAGCAPWPSRPDAARKLGRRCPFDAAHVGGEAS